MDIKTKYNVGDTVFTVDPKTLKATSFEVNCIIASTFGEKARVTLSPKQSEYSIEQYEESLCFPTLDELLNHIKG